VHRSSSFFFLATLLLSFTVFFLPTRAQATDMQTAFQTLRTQAVWPVVGTTLDHVESTFGPRIKPSTELYDWHRGIDIDASLGTPVLAAMTGELWKIENYVSGGTTVTLRHRFPTPVSYQGKVLYWYYTFYMHLDSISSSLRNAYSAGLHPTIAAGTFIATVGQTGTTVANHLHFELRIGTWCSLEFQLLNPTSSCAGFGFDPHVHPLLLYTPLPSSMSLSLLTRPTSAIDGRVRFTVRDEQPLLNRVTVAIVHRATGRIVATHTLDLNLRTGYNATTNAALDTINRTKPYILPLPFDMSKTAFATDLVIPKGFVSSYYGSSYLSRITVRDIWGNTVIQQW
jgi:Peptidase family M23